jgi:ABC-type nitrate/sulfonate/bicarbonate transport system substrate-binding protein
MFDVKHRRLFLAALGFSVLIHSEDLPAQAPEKVLITHSSESISITPLIYGIDKGFYRREGIDLQFRVLRGELAVSSIIGGKDVDYMYGAGTAITA